MSRSYSFEAVVWEHDGPAAWHFVSLPADCADQIADAVEGRTPAFGSVRVEATIGSTRWTTSIFPDSARGTYVLPVRKSVRAAEGLADGSPAQVHLRVPDP